MTVRNLSPATQRSYVHAVAKFGRFFGRSPEKLDLEDSPRLSGSPGGRWDVVAGAEPDRLRTALPVWHHPREARLAGADRARPRAAKAARCRPKPFGTSR